MNNQDIITVEPGKRGGQPCIRGLRITVYDVLSYLDVRFAINIAGLQPATEISSSLYFHRNTTGESLSSRSASSIRRFSSSFDSTRIPRRMLRASFEKKVSIRFSHEPCVGVKMNSNRLGRVPRNALVSFYTCAE